MTPPTNIDGIDITGATIDGQEVQEITIDGQTVFAAGPKIIDDFNDNDFSEYSTARGWNGTQSTAQSIEGGSSVVFTEGDITSFPGDGLNHYPVRGEIVSLWYRPSDTFCNVILSIGLVPAGGEGYRIEFIENQQEINLLKFTSNGAVTLGTDSAPLSPGEWYKLELDWDTAGDGTLVYTVYEGFPEENQIGQITASDSAYSSGGFRIIANSNTGSNRFVDFFVSRQP